MFMEDTSSDSDAGFGGQFLIDFNKKEKEMKKVKELQKLKENSHWRSSDKDK